MTSRVPGAAPAGVRGGILFEPKAARRGGEFYRARLARSLGARGRTAARAPVLNGNKKIFRSPLKSVNRAFSLADSCFQRGSPGESFSRALQPQTLSQGGRMGFS